MVWHTGFGQLTQKIGGYFPMAAYPQFPVLSDGLNIADFTFYDDGMKFFIFNGEDDPIFVPGPDMDELSTVFALIGLNIDSVIQSYTVTKDVGHELDPRYFDVMMAFVKDKSVTEIKDYERRDTPLDGFSWSEYLFINWDQSKSGWYGADLGWNLDNESWWGDWGAARAKLYYDELIDLKLAERFQGKLYENFLISDVNDQLGLSFELLFDSVLDFKNSDQTIEDSIKALEVNLAEGYENFELDELKLFLMEQ